MTLFDRNDSPNGGSFKERFLSADPFPHIVLDNAFPISLMERFADAFPSYGIAQQQGREFRKSKEYMKVGVSNYDEFPIAGQELSDLLSSDSFLEFLSDMSGIDDLLADPKMVGGGLHLTAPGGRLDVHVDFNYREDFKWHRRLNLLVYLNKEWNKEWGGQLELWDEDVRSCQQVLEPLFNRCVIFETSAKSYHGVRPIKLEAPRPRQSFAAYYYTEAAPKMWNGERHSTIFKTRPDEESFLGKLLSKLSGR